jgi:hypothetical protein
MEPNEAGWLPMVLGNADKNGVAFTYALLVKGMPKVLLAQGVFSRHFAWLDMPGCSNSGDCWFQ